MSSTTPDPFLQAAIRNPAPDRPTPGRVKQLSGPGCCLTNSRSARTMEGQTTAPGISFRPGSASRLRDADRQLLRLQRSIAVRVSYRPSDRGRPVLGAQKSQGEDAVSDGPGLIRFLTTATFAFKPDGDLRARIENRYQNAGSGARRTSPEWGQPEEHRFQSPASIQRPEFQRTGGNSAAARWHSSAEPSELSGIATG
jgi:hypothetical protein